MKLLGTGKHDLGDAERPERPQGINGVTGEFWRYLDHLEERIGRVEQRIIDSDARQIVFYGLVILALVGLIGAVLR